MRRASLAPAIPALLAGCSSSSNPASPGLRLNNATSRDATVTDRMVDAAAFVIEKP